MGVNALPNHYSDYRGRGATEEERTSPLSRLLDPLAACHAHHQSVQRRPEYDARVGAGGGRGRGVPGGAAAEEPRVSSRLREGGAQRETEAGMWLSGCSLCRETAEHADSHRVLSC